MKPHRFITTNITKYLKENKLQQVVNIGLSVSNKIEGGFLNKKQAEDLQKEIESNYDDIAKFGQDSNDIRRSLFNYDNPLLEKDINGVNLRITSGLVEGVPYSGNRRKTYLLYADGKIVGKFYSVNDIKKVIKYIEDNLIKNTISNQKQYLTENVYTPTKIGEFIYHQTNYHNASDILKHGFKTGFELDKGERNSGIFFSASHNGQENTVYNRGKSNKRVMIEVATNGLNLLDLSTLPINPDLLSYQQEWYKIVRNIKEKNIFPVGYDGILIRSQTGGIYEIALKKDVANKNITGRIKNLRGRYINI